VLGAGGHGLAADFPGEIDIILGTGGKALGSGGAFIACNTVLRDYIIQRCSGFIYSTALPPPVTGSLLAALKLIPAMEEERIRLREHASMLGNPFPTAIVPVILGNEQTTITTHQHLREKGFFCPVIRPPTVPNGTVRLRISLNATQPPPDIQRLTNLLKDIRP
jgi:8-amino-7-oxononanoate synthase